MRSGRGFSYPYPQLKLLGCREPRGSRKANSEEGMEGYHEGEAPLEGRGNTAT